MKKILAINPGATSTKVAIFDGNEQIFLKNIKHSTEELSQFHTIADQYEFRKNIITSTLEAEGINLHDISIVMGRGGLVKPLKSGVYKVNDLMLEHLKMGYSGQHACNLGGLIADSIAKYIGLECAYIADPVMVDEMQEIARISGHPDFVRQSIFHALNHKAIGRMYAKDNGKKYEDLNLIITHMGGGVSVGAHPADESVLKSLFQRQIHPARHAENARRQRRLCRLLRQQRRLRCGESGHRRRPESRTS